MSPSAPALFSVTQTQYIINTLANVFAQHMSAYALTPTQKNKEK